MKIILAYIICASILYGANVCAKRAAPAPVNKVEMNSVVYSAPPFVTSENQNGGYVEARDKNSNELLWRLKVYKTEYNNKLERDVQDIFITSIKLEGGIILVTDEKGRVFAVNLKTKGVVRNK